MGKSVVADAIDGVVDHQGHSPAIHSKQCQDLPPVVMPVLSQTRGPKATGTEGPD
jgi:hypothetical protein